MTDLNPQAKQMADESMVRNLDAQARAIWPQEMPLLRRYALPAEARILDAGCGTGEGSSRLAELFPRAKPLAPCSSSLARAAAVQDRRVTAVSEQTTRGMFGGRLRLQVH